MRIELEDWEGETRYAAYSSFTVASEADKYRLSLSSYTGTASADQSADISGGMLYYDNTMFSTYDQDNDGYPSTDCIAHWGYGGFWFGTCSQVGLNNRFHSSSVSPDPANAYNVIKWTAWHGATYSLRKCAMMIRPTRN